MIKIGIIGAGNIAKKFSEAVNNSQLIDGELHAIASRSIEKAEIFKNQHNIKNSKNDLNYLLILFLGYFLIDVL